MKGNVRACVRAFSLTLLVSFGSVMLLTSKCHAVFGMKTLDSHGFAAVNIPLDVFDTRVEKTEVVAAEFEELSRESKIQFERISAKKKKIEGELSRKVKLPVEGTPQGIADIFGKRSSILNDTLQVLTSTEEAWKSLKNVYECYIKHLKKSLEIQSETEGEKQQLKGTLKELHEIEDARARKLEELGVAYAAAKGLKRQEHAELERLAALKRELGFKRGAYTEIESKWETLDVSKAEDMTKSERLKLDIEVAQLDSTYTELKISLSELRIKEMNVDVAMSESEHYFDGVDLKVLDDRLEKIKSVLRVEAGDVKRSRIRWQEQARSTVKEKERLSSEGDEKREKKRTLDLELSSLNDELKQCETQNDGAHVAIWYDIKSKILNIKYLIRVVNLESRLINIRIELTEAEESKKFLSLNAMEIRYQMRGSEIDLAKHVYSLEQQQNSLESAIKHTENSMSDALRMIEQRNLKSAEIRTLIDTQRSVKDTVFRGKSGKYRDAIELFETVKDAEKGSQLNAAYLSLISELDSKQKYLLNQTKLLVREFNVKRREVDIWKRSPRAISVGHMAVAAQAAEIFFKRLFWGTPEHFFPMSLWRALKTITFSWFVGLLLFLLILAVSFLVARRLLREIHRRLAYLTSVQHSRTTLLYYLLLSGIVDFVFEQFAFIFSWLFIHASIRWSISIWGFSFAQISPYLRSVFYLASIPMFIFLTKKFIASLGTLNQRLSYFFFNETSQGKATRLISYVLYSGSVILPLRLAFMQYGPTGSQLPEILLAAYSMVLLVVVLLVFNKEDVLSLIPGSGSVFIWLKKQVDRYYYPAFMFLVGLLIISNPYVGYSNLAWFLAFAVPASILLSVGMLSAHHYLREYSLFVFFKEDEEGAVDRFDHAKMLYAFFVILTFLSAVFIGIVLFSRVWGAPYTVQRLWHAFSQEWALDIGDREKFGIVQLLIFSAFTALGYFISSLVNKLLLDQLFDVFKVESGAQNTILRITQYIIIIFFVTLGLVAVNLSGYVVYALGLLIVGIGLGIKDQIADFFAGILILLERQIEIGHFIETENTRGTVHTISIRSTIIRTANNYFVAIPNRDLISKPIVNWGAGRVAVGMEIRIRVAYGTDIERVRSIFSEVLYSHPLVLRVPSVVVRLEEFEDSSMQIFARAFVSARKVREVWVVASDVRISLLKMFQTYEIQIPFPQQVVHLRDKQDQSGGNLEIKIDTFSEKLSKGDNQQNIKSD